MNKIFSMNFNNLRKQNNKTQKELAEAFNVSQNTIHSWENGRQEPNGEKLKEIAVYFNVDVNYLLGQTASKEIDTHTEIKIKQAFKDMGIDKMSEDELKSFLHIAKAAAETIKKKD